MADLTLYFPSSGAAAHNCAYSATWENTTAAVRYPGTTTRGSTDIAVQECARNNGQHLGMGGQWVYPAMAARSFTTADTFDFVFPVNDNSGSGSSTLWLIIRVFSADGATAIGTLYDGNINTVVWGTFCSRHADGVAVQNNVDLPENGHIVVEVGIHDAYPATFSNRIYPQELGVNGALPLNDTDTSQEKYPWLAFTYGAAPPTGMANDIVLIFEC